MLCKLPNMNLFTNLQLILSFYIVNSLIANSLYWQHLVLFSCRVLVTMYFLNRQQFFVLRYQQNIFYYQIVFFARLVSFSLTLCNMYNFIIGKLTNSLTPSRSCRPLKFHSEFIGSIAVPVWFVVEVEIHIFSILFLGKYRSNHHTFMLFI